MTTSKNQTYDIAIVGAGPFGLTLSTILARWGYSIKHIDNRPHPTTTGRADGIQPRSLDLLRNMGLKRGIMAKSPAKVYEVAFWDPDSSESQASISSKTNDRAGDDEHRDIVRTGTWASCPSFIDARYPFTTLLHQGHIERVFLDDMAKNGVSVQRPWRISDFENTSTGEHPIRVEFTSERDSNVKETVFVKYLLDGEGARSFVREKLGIKMQYKDPIAYVWGVMDGVVRTDFPDIKMKCTIHSDAGSIMVIPREDNMVRLYIQIASSTDPDFNPRKTSTEEEVMTAAKKILKPYYIEWDSVAWFSVYPIGQGISERYTLDERVFMGGDACHTHSPKAGQGMNTAFLDAANLAWKIHHVESGFADRSALLPTYESERKHVAEELLAFDNTYAKLFSSRIPSAKEVKAASAGQEHTGKTMSDSDKEERKLQEEEGENDFVKTFKANCEFTSGYGVKYGANAINWDPETSNRGQFKSSLFVSSSLAHSAKSSSSTTTTTSPVTYLKPGRILPPSTVTRVIDANTVHLEQEVPLNGAFRIYIFAGSSCSSSHTHPALTSFAQSLSQSSSFLSAFPHSDPNYGKTHYHDQTTPHSPFFTFLTIIPAPRSSIEISQLPPLLGRYRKHIYADDVWDHRVPDAKASAHAKMGILAAEKNGKQEGRVVVVRPDGYVGCVVKLVEGRGTVDALDEYFGSFSTKRIGRKDNSEARL